MPDYIKPLFFYVNSYFSNRKMLPYFRIYWSNDFSIYIIYNLNFYSRILYFYNSFFK